MMQRIAARLARVDGYRALVTGECMGQVASQTLENLICIGAATEMHVLRPLIAFDKEETIEIARRIGTFDISNRPDPDCCTVFQPARPMIRGKLAEAGEWLLLFCTSLFIVLAVAGAVFSSGLCKRIQAGPSKQD